MIPVSYTHLDVYKRQGNEWENRRKTSKPKHEHVYDEEKNGEG